MKRGDYVIACNDKNNRISHHIYGNIYKLAAVERSNIKGLKVLTFVDFYRQYEENYTPIPPEHKPKKST